MTFFTQSCRKRSFNSVVLIPSEQGFYANVKLDLSKLYGITWHRVLAQSRNFLNSSKQAETIKLPTYFTWFVGVSEFRDRTLWGWLDRNFVAYGKECIRTFTMTRWLSRVICFRIRLNDVVSADSSVTELKLCTVQILKAKERFFSTKEKCKS